MEQVRSAAPRHHMKHVYVSSRTPSLSYTNACMYVESRDERGTSSVAREGAEWSARRSLLSRLVSGEGRHRGVAGPRRARGAGARAARRGYGAGAPSRPESRDPRDPREVTGERPSMDDTRPVGTPASPGRPQKPSETGIDRTRSYTTYPDTASPDLGSWRPRDTDTYGLYL